jgi:hypothetical protein
MPIPEQEKICRGTPPFVWAIKQCPSLRRSVTDAGPRTLRLSLPRYYEEGEVDVVRVAVRSYLVR